MTSKSDYIVRGDDGKLYRVSHEHIHAKPIASDDPAAKHAPKLHELADKLKSSGPPHPFACLIAFVDSASSSAKRD
jgi:hypothetical protein